MTNETTAALDAFTEARQAFFEAGLNLCNAWVHLYNEPGVDVELEPNRTHDGQVLLPLELEEWLMAFNDQITIYFNKEPLQTCSRCSQMLQDDDNLVSIAIVRDYAPDERWDYEVIHAACYRDGDHVA